jgi:hypothetical protein
MVTIQLDDDTAKALERKAQSVGMNLVQYLQSLVPMAAPPARVSWEEIEQQILSLSTAGPSLPDDFSRADIYQDHD